MPEILFHCPPIWPILPIHISIYCLVPVWECRSMVWEYRSVVWECWSVGVRVYKCGSGGAHTRQVCNYENINAQGHLYIHKCPWAFLFL